MKNGKKYQYILNNTHQGFDELALNLGMSKKDVKRIWNELKLGWHMTPRTLVKIRRIGHKKYELLEDLVVFIAPGTPIVTPKGFVTDCASVPRLLWWFIAPDDEGIAIPAIVHDLLCRTGWVKRYVADGIFYQLMQFRRFKRAFWAFLAVFLAGFVTGSGKDDILYKKVLEHTQDYIKDQAFDIY